MLTRSYLHVAAPAFMFGALAGSIVTGIVVEEVCRLHEASIRSKSVFATRAVIEDLDDTLKKGDCKLASKKVTIFKTRWQEWIDHDASPSAWFNEIVGMHN
jgi:hypothetical protein